MARKKKQSCSQFKSVNCSALNVRSKPSKDSLSIDVLPRYDLVEYDKKFKDDIWDHITTKDGKEGYCMKKFLEAADQDICDGKVNLSKEASDGKEN